MSSPTGPLSWWQEIHREMDWGPALAARIVHQISGLWQSVTANRLSAGSALRFPHYREPRLRRRRRRMFVREKSIEEDDGRTKTSGIDASLIARSRP